MRQLLLLTLGVATAQLFSRDETFSVFNYEFTLLQINETLNHTDTNPQTVRQTQYNTFWGTIRDKEC